MVQKDRGSHSVLDLPYACHNKPRLVYFLLHFEDHFFAFKNVFFRKFCTYVYGKYSRAGYYGACTVLILTHFEVKHNCNFLSLLKFFSLSSKRSTLWSLWCLRLPAGCLPTGCLPAGWLPMSYSLWLAARIILQSILT